MKIKYDFTNLLHSEKIEHGITKANILNNTDLFRKAHNMIIEERKENIFGFFDLPDKNTKKIKDFVAQKQDKFDNFVVLGIGGSALGNIALYSALKSQKKLKNLYVIDNVDPDLMFEVLNKIDIKKTLFNVITKSGTTAETMSTFLIILDMIKKKLGENHKENLVITTDKEKGFLRQVVKNEKYDSFIVPDNVGGRFSVLTDVGLLSSAFVGIDIDKLLSGAGEMRNWCEKENIFENPAYMNGLLHYFYMKKGLNISVMFPYSNSLYDMADWYRQLWAESLGKKNNRFGKDVFVGQTPVKALGTTDQHSQVQLYTEGPNDKVVTFMEVEKFRNDYEIADLFSNRDEVNYLAGKKLSSLLNTERLATEIALTDAGCPNCNIVFPEINEYFLGQFIFMYEVQTVFTGNLLNIDPLNQPGVEAGKKATYAMMGKKGFAKENENVKRYKKNKKNNEEVI